MHGLHGSAVLTAERTQLFKDDPVTEIKPVPVLVSGVAVGQHRGMTSRRAFLATALSSAAALAARAADSEKPASPSAEPKPISLAISSYSYWHFKTEKVPIETVIDKTAKLGVPGVDILHRQMDIGEFDPLDAKTHSYCQRIKRHAFRAGVDLVCLSIHQDFVSPNPAERHKWIAHTQKCIEIAYAMGIPCIRLNSGRWKTIKDFDELMKARGIEPVLKGYTEDDAFKWCIESIQKCLELAAQRGVILALENHWGLTSQPAGQLRILSAIESPWLGALMDTGNFLEDPVRKARADRSENGLRAGEDVSGWRRMVHARFGLQTHREDSPGRGLRGLRRSRNGRQGRSGQRRAEEYRDAARGVRVAGFGSSILFIQESGNFAAAISPQKTANSCLPLPRATIFIAQLSLGSSFL